LPTSGLEIRWFFDGPVPAPVSSWFEKDSRLGAPLAQSAGEKRTDTYLLAEKSIVPVAMKISRGNLELKLRETAGEFSINHDSIRGYLETWSKWQWTYGASADDPVSAAFLRKGNQGATRPVNKNRLQRKFSVANPETAPIAVSSDIRVDRGCAVELTNVNADANVGWTLAVESLGSTDNLLLTRCVQFILQNYPGPVLRLDNSYSYPVWLSKRQTPS